MVFKNFLVAILLCTSFTFIFGADYAADAYVNGETNGIASSFCRVVKFMNNAIIPIAAVMLSVTGFAAFKGELKPASLITFAIAIAVFRNPTPLLAILVPGNDLEYGCKCVPEKKILRRNIDYAGNSIWTEIVVSTGVDEDCNPIRN